MMGRESGTGNPTGNKRDRICLKHAPFPCVSCMPMRLVHAHASRACPCVSCKPMHLLHAHASRASPCVSRMSMRLVHAHASRACVSWMCTRARTRSGSAASVSCSRACDSFGMMYSISERFTLAVMRSGRFGILMRCSSWSPTMRRMNCTATELCEVHARPARVSLPRRPCTPRCFAPSYLLFCCFFSIACCRLTYSLYCLRIFSSSSRSKFSRNAATAMLSTMSVARDGTEWRRVRGAGTSRAPSLSDRSRRTVAQGVDGA